MGGLTSVASTAIQALGIANTLIGAVDSYRDKSGRRDYDRLKSIQELENRQALERAGFEKERIRIDAQAADSERRASLRRAMAKRRAQAGADGIGSYDGSSEAVLLGLFDESDEDRRQREALDNLRRASIDQGVSQQQSLNTLKLTQQKESNRLKNLTSAYDAVSTIGSIF